MDELPVFLGSLEFIDNEIVRQVRAGYRVSVCAFRIRRGFLHRKATGRVCVLIKYLAEASAQFRSVGNI